MELNMIINLSLYNVYMDNVLERYPDLPKEISNKPNQLCTNINSMGLDSAKVISKLLVHLMNLSINKQCIYITTWLCMKCSCCLYLIRIDKNWELQLSALDKIVRYFFAHDQLNFVHHAPLYLDTMTELKMKNIDSWNYLEDNFSINRSGIYCFAP